MGRGFLQCKTIRASRIPNESDCAGTLLNGIDAIYGRLGDGCECHDTRAHCTSRQDGSIAGKSNVIPWNQNERFAPKYPHRVAFCVQGERAIDGKGILVRREFLCCGRFRALQKFMWSTARGRAAPRACERLCIVLSVLGDKQRQIKMYARKLDCTRD